LRNALFADLMKRTPNRRSLLKKLGVASAALGAGGSTAMRLAADPAVPSAEDIVQFALNLEYLEGEFYSIATTGQTLSQRGFDLSGIGTPGETTTSFGAVRFFNLLLLTGDVAKNIAADEIAHVQVIRAALLANGITPIAKPAINLDALAAQDASLHCELSFLKLSRIFEDIGVSAYTGGAPYLANSPYLQTAARITAIEGEHVANVRFQIARLGIKTTPLDEADVIPPPSGNNFFSTNLANGLPPTRTPGQVLYLAYGNVAGVTAGGFFPNGVNGALVTSTGPATAQNLAT
jgi:hypothetical protein